MNAVRLYDILLERPWITVSLAAELLGIAFVTANKTIERFSDLGLLHEVTGQRRNRIFSYSRYLVLFEDPQLEDESPIQGTEAA